jgi:hypothetical protein
VGYGACLLGRELPPIEPNPLFKSIRTFENNFESTSKEPFSGILTRQLWSSEMVPFLREAMRAIDSLGCEGAMRAIASSMSPHVFSPAGPHTDIQCRNRRQHNSRSNRQRRREDTSNDRNSRKVNRRKGQG